MRKIGMMRSAAVILTSAISRAFRWLSVPVEMISEMW
jgi:hypothetical protein